MAEQNQLNVGVADQNRISMASSKEVKWSDEPLYLYEFVLWTLLLNFLSTEPLNSLKHNISNPSDYWPCLCGIKIDELARECNHTHIKANE